MEQIRELVSNLHFTDEVWAIMLPIALMGIDIVTGLVNAWIKGIVDSSKLRKGLAKKFGEMSAILVGELIVLSFGLPIGVADSISIYIIIMELISICENLTEMDVPVPKFIKNALKIVSDNIKENKKLDESSEEAEENDSEKTSK